MKPVLCYFSQSYFIGRVYMGFNLVLRWMKLWKSWITCF